MPTINELRQSMDQASADAPNRIDRAAAVRRRIRRGNRMRVAGGGVAAVTALAVAGILVTGTDAGPRATNPPMANVNAVMSASSNTALPQQVMGMPLLLAQRFSASGKKVRLTFTPTGPFTHFTIQCAPGFIALTWTNGLYENDGDCNRRFNPLGAEATATPTAGYLPAGKPVRFDIVVIPASAEKTVDTADGTGNSHLMSVREYLAKTPPGRAAWSTAIYSGVCKEDCPPPLPPGE